MLLDILALIYNVHKTPILRADDPIESALHLFRDKSLSTLPVMGDDNALIAVLSVYDLLEGWLAGAAPTDPIRSVCSKDFHCHQVARTHVTPLHLLQNNEDSVAIDAIGRLVGMLDRNSAHEALCVYGDWMFGISQTFQEVSNHGFIVLNAIGNIICISKSASMHLGQPTEALQGKTIETVFPFLLWADIVKSRTESVYNLATASKETLPCLIVPILRNDVFLGAVIHFQPKKLLVQYAQLESNATFKTRLAMLEGIMDSMGSGILALNEQGHILYANDIFCQYFDLSADTLRNALFSDVLSSETTLVQDISHARYFFTPVDCKKVYSPEYGGTYEYSIKVNTPFSGAHSLVVMMNFNKEEPSGAPLPAAAEEDKKLINFDDYITIHPTMLKMKRSAEMAAKTDATILITGESGTGKEIFAEAIHNASLRRGRPFLKVNAAAIPETLFESEFFGYAPGTFTGGLRTGKTGKFQEANGGTIFLDEIGDMSLNLQGKLLRVLQSKTITPVGQSEAIPVDVRIIAATNKDLQAKVRDRSFRLDLYYRLNVITFELLPLRERRVDQAPLIRHFLEKFNRKYGKKVTQISIPTAKFVREYDWPGNVRELENMVERMVILTTGQVASHLELSDSLTDTIYPAADPSPAPKAPRRGPRPKRDALTKEEIEDALNEYDWNKSKAAAKLGISRAWIYRCMQKYGIQDMK